MNFSVFYFCFTLDWIRFCCSGLVNEIEYRNMAEKKKQIHLYIDQDPLYSFWFFLWLQVIQAFIAEQQKREKKAKKSHTLQNIHIHSQSVLSIMRKNVIGFFGRCVLFAISANITDINAIHSSWIWKTWIKRPSAMTPFAVFFLFGDFKNIQQKKAHIIKSYGAKNISFGRKKKSNRE